LNDDLPVGNLRQWHALPKLIIKHVFDPGSSKADKILMIGNVLFILILPAIYSQLSIFYMGVALQL
jgi:hypothetical protein